MCGFSQIIFPIIQLYNAVFLRKEAKKIKINISEQLCLSLLKLNETQTCKLN